MKNTLKTMIWLACWWLGQGVALAAVNLPPFSLPTAIDGTVISSEAYRGRAMLITFFATWCPPCIQEIPALKAVQARYAAQGFSVVALAVDEGGNPVAQLVHKASINYPVLLSDQPTRNSFGGVATIPTSFLVNRAGHVVKKYPGLVPRSLLERDIESVL